jgi:hypothetical protein
MKRTFLLCAFVLCPLPLGMAGCGNAGEGVAQTKGQNPEDLLANAMEALKDDRPTVGTYRTAVQQLDTYLNARKDVADQFLLRQAERDLIGKQLLAGLLQAAREERIKDLERKSFTQVDAYHLDSCFLFRDAAEALRQYYVADPPLPSDPKYPASRLELARVAFDWVVRQVDLKPQTPGLDAWPAHDILRRGTGDGEERARVFLGLLEQLGLDGCVVTRSIDVVVDGKREPRELIWIPGVLIGGDVYLFETRLGTPVPGPGGQGIATLREVPQHPDILQKLYAGDADAVTRAQIEKPAVLVPSSLSALAPRMRELQSWLTEAGNKAIVHEDLPATLQRFREAKLDVDVRLWTTRSGYPTLVLHRYVENPKAEPRLQEAIVPRRALIPNWFHEVAAQIGPARGQQLYRSFDRLILSVRVQPVSEEVWVVEQGRTPTGLPQVQQKTTRTGGVRDLLVRGRPEQSIDRALGMETDLAKVHDVFRTQLDFVPGQVEERLRTEWAPKLLAAFRRLDELQLQRQHSPSGKTAALAEGDLALRNAAAVLEGQFREQELDLRYLSAEWAKPEVQEHLTYFTALAKLELAIRAEVGAARRGGTVGQAAFLSPAQQYASAASWFERYQALVLPRVRNSWGPAAAKHLATCRAAQQRLEQK